MPEVFRVGDVRVCVDYAIGGKHSPFHFHVYVGDQRASLDLFTLEVIVGARVRIPRNARREIEKRHAEILKKWEQCNTKL